MFYAFISFHCVFYVWLCDYITHACPVWAQWAWRRCSCSGRQHFSRKQEWRVECPKAVTFWRGSDLQKCLNANRDHSVSCVKVSSRLLLLPRRTSQCKFRRESGTRRQNRTAAITIRRLRLHYADAIKPYSSVCFDGNTYRDSLHARKWFCRLHDAYCHPLIPNAYRCIWTVANGKSSPSHWRDPPTA